MVTLNNFFIISSKTFWTKVDVFYNVNNVNVNHSVKKSTVDCKYLLFLQDFFLRLKPKQYKKCQYSFLFKKIHLETQNIRTIFWRNNWHNIWRSIFDKVERLAFLIDIWLKRLTYSTSQKSQNSYKEQSCRHSKSQWETCVSAITFFISQKWCKKSWNQTSSIDGGLKRKLRMH